MRNAQGLSRWQHVAIGVAVAVQGAALARVSSWLHPAWSMTLAIAAAVATLAVVRARRAAVALAANLALTCGVFGLLGMAVGALQPGHAGVAGWSWGNLLMAAVWWWALQAPVVVARWRTKGLPEDAAARLVAEALGASLLASALVLLTTGVARVGLTWSCLALAVAMLAWAWRRRTRRRDPEGPPEHAGEGGGAPYRGVRAQTPAGRSRFSWGRWALFAATLGWGVALTRQGVWRFARVGPRGQWSAVARAMGALRVVDDPCGSVARGAGSPEFTWRSGNGFPFEEIIVWGSGAIAWSSSGTGDCGGSLVGRCLPAETARRFIEHTRGAATPDYDELRRLVREPMATQPPACAAGRWCSISTEYEGDILAGHCGFPRFACTLRIDGLFYRGSERREFEQSGRIPATAARSLIEAVQAAASARGPLAMHSWAEGDRCSTSSGAPYAYGMLQPVFVVGVGPGDLRYRVDFPQSPAIEGLLWQKLCNALPLRGDGWSPAAPTLQSDDP